MNAEQKKIALKHSNHIQDHHELSVVHDDNFPSVQKMVAKKTNSPELIDKFMSKHWSVKEALASNKHLSKHHYEKLMHDKSSLVAEQAARNTPHEDHHEQLLKTGKLRHIYPLIMNPHVAPHHLTDILNHFDNIGNSASSIGSFDEERYNIARHPNATHEHHLHLSNHHNFEVRLGVAQHTKHKDILQKLSNDRNVYVNELAKKRLESNKF